MFGLFFIACPSFVSHMFIAVLFCVLVADAYLGFALTHSLTYSLTYSLIQIALRAVAAAWNQLGRSSVLRVVVKVVVDTCGFAWGPLFESALANDPSGWVGG